MKFIFLILIVVAILITLLFVEAIKVKIMLDTDKEEMNMTILWLYPFLKVKVVMEAYKPVLKFYLFNKHLFDKPIKKKKRKYSGVQMLKFMHPQNIYLNANYGFSNPYTTGITCGAINAASQLINIEYLKHNPDFTTGNSYIYLDASARINLGLALFNSAKEKYKGGTKLWTKPQT